MAAAMANFNLYFHYEEYKLIKKKMNINALAYVYLNRFGSKQSKNKQKNCGFLFHSPYCLVLIDSLHDRLTHFLCSETGQFRVNLSQFYAFSP